MGSNERLAYSTSGGGGILCLKCRQPVSRCACKSKSGKGAAGAGPAADPRDGVVRVRREVAGRRGKPVTTVTGVPIAPEELDKLASNFKKRCGCGGSAKNGVIEIQGDHRDLIVAELQNLGYTVKLAGG